MKILLLITTIAIANLFALVTITPVEIGAKAGFSTKIEASLETTRGNTDTDSYKGAIRTTYDNNESFVIWGEAAGAYGEANGIENKNKLFSHVRYIHAMQQNDLRFETFGQLENDEFKNINSRVLGGAGVRFKTPKIVQDSKGYLGIGAFYETISYKESGLNPSEDNIRLNSYFAYTQKLSRASSLSYMLYFQPKLDDFDDSVTSHELELKLSIFKQLSLKFNMLWNRDSQPAVGVKNSDFTQNTSFVLSF